MPQIATISQAAAVTDRNPTKAQAVAGNYRKGRCLVHGMKVEIENPRGSVRRGVSKAGKAWSITMKHHYGAFLEHTGKDGDPLDVVIGPDADATHVYVVNQVNPDGAFDEHKCLVHFKDEAAARAGYLANYESGWKGLGSLKAFTLKEFETWVSKGNFTKKAALFFVA